MAYCGLLIYVFYIMTEDENIKLLLYTNVITFTLWVLSEILGMSKCEYNGVIQLIFSGVGCLRGREIHLDISIHDATVQEQAHLL